MKKLLVFLCAIFFAFPVMAACTGDQIDVLGNGTQCETAKFTLTTVADTTTFQFTLSAKGTFYVDCGNGGTLTSSDTTNYPVNGAIVNHTYGTTKVTYTCTWGTGAAQTIRFGGVATDYNASESNKNNVALSFWSGSSDANKNANAAKIASLSGNLSVIFPYKTGNAANGAQPRFYGLFRAATNLTSVPSTLFTNYTKGSTYMFWSAFNGCSNLTTVPGTLFGTFTTGADRMFQYTFGDSGITTIPPGLFGAFTTGGQYMFYDTFYNCSNLTSIPNGLFNSIDTLSATNTSYMFKETFYGCTGLTSIPSGLFSGIDTSSATNTSSMFNATFYGCSNLASIPNGLFDSIDTSSATNTSSMFRETFYNCSNLASIPNGLFDSIDTSSSTNTSYMFYSTFLNTKITSIPSDLFDNIDTSSATSTNNMFYSTFSNTRITSIPSDLFDNIDTSSATNTSYMFQSTFYGCSNLASVKNGNTSTTYIPGDFLGNITGASSNVAQNMFANTALKSPCPSDTNDVTPSIFSNAGKPWCEAVGVNCSAGQYLPANANACATCTAGNVCTGGTYTFNENTDQGITACGAGKYSAAGASACTNITAGYYATGCTNGTTCTGQSQCTGTTYCAGGVQYSCPTGYAANTTAGKSAISQCQTTCAAGNYMASGTYTKLEYIRSDGSAYINTAYTPTSNTKVEVVAQMDSGAGNLNIVGSGYSGGNGSSSDVLLVINSYDNNHPEIKFMPSTAWNSSITTDMTKKNTLSLSTTEFAVNGSVLATNTQSMTGNGTIMPFYLFQRWRPTISSTNSKVKIYNLSIYENENLVRDMIPVRRNSDSVLGMLDLVSGTFFTNAGTGTFVAGPDVGPIGGTCTNTNSGYYATAATIGYGTPAPQTACPVGNYSPSGAAMCYPHILHVGNDDIYMKSTKQTTPSLNMQIGNDKFYAHMTTTRTKMNKDSDHYFHVQWGNNDYYVCDDTTCPQ